MAERNEILEELRAIREQMERADKRAQWPPRLPGQTPVPQWPPRLPGQYTPVPTYQYRCGRCQDTGIDYHYHGAWLGIYPPNCPKCSGGYTAPSPTTADAPTWPVRGYTYPALSGNNVVTGTVNLCCGRQN